VLQMQAETAFSERKALALPSYIRIHYDCQSGRRWNRGRTKTDYVRPVADDSSLSCWKYRKQARKYMYTVILSSVRVDTFKMENYLSIKYFELVCLYPWILSAPYFIAICGLSGCIVSRWHDFRKNC